MLAIISYASSEVLRYSFDVDIGFVHVMVDEPPEPIALADNYRLDGTGIVEHWDVTQARPANATNPIAMFWDGHIQYTMAEGLGHRIASINLHTTIYRKL